jgi:hypothetical protein|tara:strand:+ start:1794 stop:2231 length:438 start_codon:yes stop_codon:yes gene_type:complete
MKVTKRQLRRIIKEEKRRILEARNSKVFDALDDAVRAAVAEKGVQFVNDWLIGTAEEVMGGQYGASPREGMGGGVEDRIAAAVQQIGFTHTEIMTDNDVYIDTDESPYGEPWDKLEKLVKAIPGVVEVYEGDDGMVIEIDWDEAP